MKFLVILALIFSTKTFSASLHTGMTYSIQPFVGYEKALKYYPSIHYKDRLVYGARIIAGYLAIAGEAEVSTSQDTEYFYDVPLLLDPTVKVKETTERVKLGLRRTFLYVSLLSSHVRAGGQASRTKQDFTNKGVTTSSTSPIKIAPYLGAGVKISFMQKCSLVADGVVIINDVHDFKRTEYQGTGAISIDF